MIRRILFFFVYTQMKESVRIFRFAVIGTLNALITALVVGIMMHYANQDYMLANIVAYVIAQAHNFVWSKYWIFPLQTETKKNNIWHQMLFFSGAFLIANSSLKIRQA